MIYVDDYKMSFDIKKYNTKDYSLRDENDKPTKVTISDNIFTFDCESTSYYVKKDGSAMIFDYNKDSKWYKKNIDKYQSVMYIWQFGIDDTVIYGRTFEQLKTFIDDLTVYLGDVRAIIYIHNLSFDFQFLRNAIGSKCEVFTRKERKPMKAYYESLNIEFRCSYFLTNKSLKDAIKDVNAPIEKMVGDLDYNVMRTPLTELTDKELKYCENDILGLYYVIKQKLDSYQHVHRIPLTQTGQVRRAFKDVMKRERKYMESVALSWPDYDEFKMLTRAFYGGYTHANKLHTNQIRKDVISMDITSSYPYVLCTQKYPTRRFTKSLNKNLDFLDMDRFAFIADVTLTNVKAKNTNSFLSAHKSLKEDADGSMISNNKIIRDNGRIREADKLRYVLTDQDLIILNNTYTFDVRINELYTAPKDYLPKSYIEFILKLFNLKTNYKGVEGYETLYNESKQFINSIYGMAVTKILSDSVTFDNGDWIKEELTDAIATDELFKKGNNKPFTSYSTGVFCAAYARKHLWDVMLDIDVDVVYCDTDSIKFLEKSNLKYFKMDNSKVESDIVKVCIERDIDPSLFKPTSPDGEVSKLGYFEEDGVYKEFKTLGAKKYAYIEEGSDEVKITVAGVNKKTGKKAFKTLEDFKCETFLDYEFAGKNMVRYNDDQEPYTFEDGFTTRERYGIIITPTTYNLDITPDYLALINGELELEDGNFNLGDGAKILNKL